MQKIACRVIASLALTATIACGPGRESPRPHVLLISVDTLRADHLGSYGNPNPTSPTIDQLAARGVRFEDTSVPWPKTWPSMASLMTGTYPATHGVVLEPHRALGAGSVTLAERLRDAGWNTSAVVSNANLGRGFGFDQGFDRFVESWAEPMAQLGRKASLSNSPGAVKRYTNATLVTDQAIELLRGCEGETRCFWWLHYIDPHGPYVPPPAYAELFAGSYPPAPVSIEDIPHYQRQRLPGSDEVITDLGFYRLQYDREIRYLDTEIARLLAAIDALPGERETLVVFTSDHGESFGERSGDALRHGFVPYQTNARVPLMLVWPGQLPAGHVVRAPVGLIDLAPTILALLDLPTEGLAGQDLGPVLRDESRAPAHVFVESGHAKPTQLVVRRGPWKLVQMRALSDRIQYRAPQSALYDVHADPAERNDLAERHPDVVRELSAALDAWLRDTPVHAGGDAAPVDDDTRDMLRALGYAE